MTNLSECLFAPATTTPVASATVTAAETAGAVQSSDACATAAAYGTAGAERHLAEDATVGSRSAAATKSPVLHASARLPATEPYEPPDSMQAHATDTVDVPTSYSAPAANSPTRCSGQPARAATAPLFRYAPLRSASHSPSNVDTSHAAPTATRS